MKKLLNTGIFLRIAAIALLAVAASSCSSTKKAASSAASATLTQSVGEPKADFRSMVDSYKPAWEKVRIPVSANITKPVSIGASGYLTMVRGKSVSLSMRVLGMEVASLYLTSDTVVVVDRWNKRYISEGLTRFLAGFPVTIDNVQDLLLGRIFIAGRNDIKASDAGQFVFEQSDGLWACKPKDENGLFSYAFVCMARTLSLLHVTAGNGGADVTYFEPQLTSFGAIASGLSLSTKAGKKDVALTLDYKPSKAQWNDDVNASTFKLPVGYTRVDASTVLKGLKF